MKRLLLLIAFLWSLSTYGQLVESVINVPIDSTGGTEQALVYMPSISMTKYPLLVFLHGAGEAGTNLSLIYNSSSAGGPAYFIEHGQWPVSYPFIVVSPQCNTWSTSGVMLDYIVQYLVSHYPIDTASIYLTGLSAGGQGIYDYTAETNSVPKYPPAAIVPMSMATSPTNQGVANTLADSVHVWGFGSESDLWGEMTHLYITGSYGGNNGPTPPALGSYGMFTPYVGGHCCWMQFYTPTYELNGFTIYTWMEQFTKSNTALALNYIKLTLNEDGSLSWTVDDTIDVDHFIIQTSTDGKTFETVTTTDSYHWIGL